MRITAEQRKDTEDRITAAAERILRGEITSDHQSDVKTLAFEAGVSRTALYSTYRELKDDFQRRLKHQREVGQAPDPREAQIAKLKHKVTTLRDRVAEQQREIADLQDFRTLAVSRLAAQHEEVLRLRRQISDTHNTVRGIGTSKRKQR